MLLSFSSQHFVHLLFFPRQTGQNWHSLIGSLQEKHNQHILQGPHESAWKIGPTSLVSRGFNVSIGDSMLPSFAPLTGRVRTRNIAPTDMINSSFMSRFGRRDGLNSIKIYFVWFLGTRTYISILLPLENSIHLLFSWLDNGNLNCPHVLCPCTLRW